MVQKVVHHPLRHGGMPGWVGVAIAALLAGCTGTITEGQTGDPSVDGPGDPEMPAGGAGGNAPEPKLDPVAIEMPDECRDVAPAIASAAVGRLTASQFRNAVFELFPSTRDAKLDLRLTETETHDEFAFSNQEELQAPTRIFVNDLSLAIERVLLHVFTGKAETEAVLGAWPAARGDARDVVEQALRRDVSRFLRRPMVGDDLKAVMQAFDTAFEDTGSLEEDVTVATAAAYGMLLHMPDFILRPEIGEPLDDGRYRLDGYAMASRMAFVLWDSPPDEALLQAAADGVLDTPDGRAQVVRDMLNDGARMARGLGAMTSQWMNWDRLMNETKDEARFPEWTDGLKASMTEQARRFVSQQLIDGPGTIGSLFDSSNFPVDSELARFFGASDPGQGWGSADLTDQHRKGLLTLPAFLSGYAHPQNSSPTLRGVFILDHLLCTPPPTPPPGVDPVVERSADAKTNREVYEQHLGNPACAGCHRIFDGMGFVLENYDTVGAYRDMENGVQVDPRGELALGTGHDGPIDGAMDLTTRLADMPEQRACTARRTFEFAVGHKFEDDKVSDACLLRGLTDHFEKSGGRFADLLAALVASESFAHRAAL